MNQQTPLRKRYPQCKLAENRRQDSGAKRFRGPNASSDGRNQRARIDESGGKVRSLVVELLSLISNFKSQLRSRALRKPRTPQISRRLFLSIGLIVAAIVDPFVARAADGQLLLSAVDKETGQ